jgi:polysaccharide export outer membrane protein
LFISVWDEEDLKAEVTIRPDGKISFPLAGEIPAVGLTFTQLNGELTQRLKKYIQGPIVSIQFKKFGGKKVIILGEVKDPGVYAVTGNKTVLEAVAMANGFTPDAVSSSVVLIRGGLQNPVGQRLDLKDALERPDNGQNVAVLSEDIVYVPRTYIASVSRVLQQIVSPIAQGIFAVRGYQLIE